MALPKYDKSKRKSNNYIQLPKGAYVIVIKGAKMDKWPSGDERIAIAFDIAEGEYKGLYQSQFDSDTRSGKQWPYDAVFNLNVPTDSSEPWVWDTYNSFFADLEDSNNGFVFSGDLKTLKGKVIGGKFHNRQSEYNGNVYDHIVMKWTCTADAVRTGKAGKLPNDKLVGDGGAHGSRATTSSKSSGDDFINVPDGADEELPF
jgi:hypothetical protein